MIEQRSKGPKMPEYDFRCKNCGQESTIFYKSYRAYDEATPQCADCGATDLSRIIRRVNVQAPSRDFASMSSNEMLSVLESGDRKQVDQMFKQVGAASPQAGIPHQDAAQKLLNDKPSAQSNSSASNSKPSQTS